MANLIFDFDGTIADTLPQYMAVLYRTDSFDLRTLGVSRQKLLRQMPLHKVFGYLRASPLTRLRVLLFHYLRMHKVIYRASLFPGVRETAIRLKTEGHRLFIVTSNTERNVAAFLKAKHLDQYFETIHHVFVARKAAGLAKFVKRKQLNIARSFYIGNEQADMQAANRVSMPAIGVLWSGQTEDALSPYLTAAFVTKPAELLHLKLLQ